MIFNRRADALQRYIEYYEKVTPTTEAALADPTEGMTAEQRLHWKIVHRHKEGVEADIDSLVPYPLTPEGITDKEQRAKNHTKAVTILNSVLLPAMKEVGDKFGAGELILPFVLQSAEVMKKAVAHLENYPEKMEGVTKGTVVIATVYGDVHDIGKNLVKTILSNNGYTVIDLGKQVPAETIIVAERWLRLYWRVLRQDGRLATRFAPPMPGMPDMGPGGEFRMDHEMLKRMPQRQQHNEHR